MLFACSHFLFVVVMLYSLNSKKKKIKCIDITGNFIHMWHFKQSKRLQKCQLCWIIFSVKLILLLFHTWPFCMYKNTIRYKSLTFFFLKWWCKHIARLQASIMFWLKKNISHQNGCCLWVFYTQLTVWIIWISFDMQSKVNSFFSLF